MKRYLTGLGLLCSLVSTCFAGGPDVKFERDRMKNILHVVSGDVEKNFYDDSMRGTDWKAQVKAAEAKIDQAQSDGEMITAIFVLVNQLNDSHTMFMPPSRVNKPLFGFNAKPFGDNVMIYEITKKSAAEKAGLKRGDRILSVNGFSAKRADFSLMMLYFHVLRPVAGLHLEYTRGNELPKTMDLQAKMKEGTLLVDLTDSSNIWNMIREYENDEKPFHYNMHDGGIGYLQLPDFESDEGFLHGLVSKVKDAKAIIIDLRGNPGGAVDNLTEFAGYFSDSPDVMAHVKRRKKDEDLKIKPRGPSITGPMYILVDSESASAAEMFARHFQRTGHAVVIGDKTSGRVNAARFFPEQIGQDTVVPFGVEVAVGQVTFPDGKQLEGTGVTPDKMCLPTSENLRDEEDPCLSMALSMAREKLGIKTPAAASAAK
jgi:C-terminal processing protease CtpA/Prc